jgi:hypothetical protein
MTAPTELLHRLQIKAGTKLWLINVPQEIAEEITAGAEVEPVHGDSYYDGVLACFAGPTEVEAMVPRILAELPPDGLLWVAYRKGEAGKEAGLTRDTGWRASGGAWAAAGARCGAGRGMVGPAVSAEGEGEG